MVFACISAIPPLLNAPGEPFGEVARSRGEGTYAGVISARALWQLFKRPVDVHHPECIYIRVERSRYRERANFFTTLFVRVFGFARCIYYVGTTPISFE